ncbi:MAG: c-type cytochrome [Rhodospirillaceae bacterium]
MYPISPRPNFLGVLSPKFRPRLPMKFVRALLVLAVFAAAPARAEDLTPAQIGLLWQDFGVRQDGQMFRDMSAEERAAIRAVYDNPFLREYSSSRNARISDLLFKVYSRQCREWSASHTSPQCPPASDPVSQAGKNIADSQCNACHIFGTAEAPAFFRLARQGGWDSRHLGAVLEDGHRMSPIRLSKDQLEQLDRYIASLK